MRAEPHRRVSLLAAALLMACGGAPAAKEPDPLRIAHGEIESLQREVAQRDAALRDERAGHQATRAKLELAETRLGQRPFRPQSLRSAPRGMRFEAGRAQRLSARDGRAQKTRLAKDMAPRRRYVVAYWATWCKPCTTPEELERVRALRDRLERMGSGLASVAVDSLKKVRADRRADTWVYPLWQRDDAHLEWLPEAFVRKAGLGLPLFVVVSDDGRLLYWHNRALDDASTEELVTAAVIPTR
jgi:hypothetical protein